MFLNDANMLINMFTTYIFSAQLGAFPLLFCDVHLDTFSKYFLLKLVLLMNEIATLFDRCHAALTLTHHK